MFLYGSSLNDELLRASNGSSMPSKAFVLRIAESTQTLQARRSLEGRSRKLTVGGVQPLGKAAAGLLETVPMSLSIRVIFCARWEVLVMEGDICCGWELPADPVGESTDG